MNIKAIIIILGVLLAYFGIHFFLYFSVLKFFSVENKKIEKILLIVFLILSLSFIFSAILARFSDFVVFRIYYSLSAFWLGLFVILFISVLLAWLAIFIFKFFGLNVKFIVGVLSFSFAFVYCLFGLYNAYNPIVKEVEIKMNNIDKTWLNKTIVQISDVHLGRINGLDFARKIVDKTNSLNPDIIFITGDLFDGMGANMESFFDILNQLQARQGIYFVTGNHEGFLDGKSIAERLKQTKIQVLDNEIAQIDGWQIIGISYFGLDNFSKQENIIESLPGFNKGKTNILLYHLPASVEQTTNDLNRRQADAYFSPNTDFSIVKNSGIDLQLSGHTHAGQFFPFTYFSRKIFNGFNYGLTQDGDFNLYVSSGAGTWGPPLRTGVKSEIVKIKFISK